MDNAETIVNASPEVNASLSTEVTHKTAKHRPSEDASDSSEDEPYDEFECRNPRSEDLPPSLRMGARNRNQFEADFGNRNDCDPWRTMWDNADSSGLRAYGTDKQNKKDCWCRCVCVYICVFE